MWWPLLEVRYIPGQCDSLFVGEVPAYGNKSAKKLYLGIDKQELWLRWMNGNVDISIFTCL